MNVFSYCFNNPILFIDDNGLYPIKPNFKKSGWNDLGSRGNFRFDDYKKEPTAHIHVKYDNKEYSWYENNHNKRHRTDLGLEDLPKSAKEVLKDKGVSDEYFDDIAIVLPSKKDALEVFHAPTQSGISVESFGAAIGCAARLCFCCFLGNSFLGEQWLR